MKVKRNTLLLLACLVWSAAGFNILRIGLMAYPAYRTVGNYLLSALVFAVFQVFIFGKLVKKHTERISVYREEQYFFLKFFDGRTFAIMAFMMTGGIPLDVAYHRAELWLLHPRGAVGRHDPDDRHADDPQNLCLCVDSAHWLFRHEKRMQVK